MSHFIKFHGRCKCIFLDSLTRQICVYQKTKKRKKIVLSQSCLFSLLLLLNRKYPTMLQFVSLPFLMDYTIRSYFYLPCVGFSNFQIHPEHIIQFFFISESLVTNTLFFIQTGNNDALNYFV